MQLNDTELATNLSSNFAEKSANIQYKLQHAKTIGEIIKGIKNGWRE
jgi:hypothetical protein